MPQPPADGGPRLIDAMPRPLLVLFVALGLFAVGASVWFLIKPPRTDAVAVHARRPPAEDSTLSHGVGRIYPAPTPSAIRRIEAPCPEVEQVTPLGGPSAVERVRLMLVEVCGLAKGGVGDEIAAAIEGLPRARIRSAQFDRTGVDSTVDLRQRVIYLNTKFVLAKIPIRQVVPVVLHEAYHLAHSGERITATEELAARTVELAACRELVRATDWPRWCSDANTLVSLPRARALDLLEQAGYPE